MDIITELFNWTWFQPVVKSPMAGLTAILTFIFGFMLKKSRRVPNDLIPLIIIPGAAFFFALVGDRALVPDTVPLGNPRTVALAGYGVVLGFLVWRFHAGIVKRFFSRKKEGDS